MKDFINTVADILEELALIGEFLCVLPFAILLQGVALLAKDTKETAIFHKIGYSTRKKVTNNERRSNS